MMEQDKTDMTTKELTEYTDTLGRAVKVQNQLNRVAHDRFVTLEKRISEINDTQLRILEILAGDSK